VLRWRASRGAGCGWFGTPLLLAQPRAGMFEGRGAGPVPPITRFFAIVALTPRRNAKTKLIGITQRLLWSVTASFSEEPEQPPSRFYATKGGEIIIRAKTLHEEKQDYLQLRPATSRKKT